jgi:hypothetical protein
MRLIEKLKRLRTEWKAGPPVPLNVKRTKDELQGLSFGLRCLMAQGGYKVRPEGMGQDELVARGDSTATLCANLHIMVRCAEEVILRHGLQPEYVQQIERVTAELNKLTAVPVQDQLLAMKALAKAGGANGEGHVRDAGGEGDGPVAEGSVQPDQQEGGTGVRG